MRFVPGRSGASYDSAFVDDMSATGDEIWERLTGRPLRVLAARPMCKLSGWSLSPRLVVSARARDIVFEIAVDILVWPLMDVVIGVDVHFSVGSQERSSRPLQECEFSFGRLR